MLPNYKGNSRHTGTLALGKPGLNNGTVANSDQAHWHNGTLGRGTLSFRYTRILTLRHVFFSIIRKNPDPV